MIKNLTIWIVCILLSVSSGFAAMGALAKNKAPLTSVNYAPLNGFAAENIAAAPVKAAIIENKGAFPDKIAAEARQWAHLAFAAEPITPGAVGILALTGKENSKFALMEKAMLLSRREKINTGWMIADSNRREDVSGILGFYDTTLRIDDEAYPVIIPILAAAVANDYFIDEFGEMLKYSPPWADSFWEQVADTPMSLTNGAKLRMNLKKQSAAESKDQDKALISALTENKKFNEATALYQFLRSEKPNANIIRNGDFAEPSEYAPLDWEVISVGEYGASITDEGLYLSSVPKSGGVFARQLISLPIGISHFQAKITHNQSSKASLYAELACAEDDNTNIRNIRINFATDIIKQKVDNPGGCAYFWLRIAGRPFDNERGFDVSIHEIALTPT